jgi:hypothetical protein
MMSTYGDENTSIYSSLPCIMLSQVNQHDNFVIVASGWLADVRRTGRFFSREQTGTDATE